MKEGEEILEIPQVTINIDTIHVDQTSIIVDTSEDPFTNYVRSIVDKLVR